MRALLAALCGATLATGCSLKETIFTPDDKLPAPTMATITIHRAGAATGDVSADGVQLSCTDACTATVAIGASITLHAAPATGGVFGGWSGDCAGTEPSCTIAVTKDLLIAAQFDVAMFNVEVATIGSGAGTVVSTSGELMCPGTCTTSVPYNTALQLVAAPASTSTFLGWTGACSGTDPCVVTVTSPVTVTAAFAANNELVVALAGKGTGLVSSSPPGISCGTDCSARFPPGTVVTLSAAPADDSLFTGWSSPGCTDPTPCTVTMDQAALITATFALQPRQLTVDRTGNGHGSVTSDLAGISCGEACTATYDAHTVVTLTATPSTDSTFTGWTGCPDSSATTCTVTLDQAASVTASFTLKQFPLSVVLAGNGHGTVTAPGISCPGDCSEIHDVHTQVTLNAAPSADSTFTSWTGCAAISGTACTVTVESAVSVTASFTLKQFPLSVVLAGNGHGTVTAPGISCPGDCSESYNAHTQVTLTAAPSADSTFTSWTGCTTISGTACTITVESAVSVTATFTLKQFPLSVVLAGNGTGTVASSPGGISCPSDCSEAYNINTVVTLTPTPATGSVFVGWSGACTGAGACQVTMAAAMAVTAGFAQQMLVAINDSTKHLERIDPTTFAVTDIGPLGVPYAFGDCMFNPADQTLYMVDGRGSFGLYRVDLTSGAASLVGPHGVSAMEAIAYHPPTNTVYSIAIDPPTSFYSLNTTTGAATTIGPVTGRFQGMAWDSTRNRMVAFDGTTMFAVDVATGGMTPIAIPQPVIDYGMTYDPSIDRFWVVDFNGQILQLDPNAGFTTTRSGTFTTGGHTCIAVVPKP